jgi:hypothetical protein
MHYYFNLGNHGFVKPMRPQGSRADAREDKGRHGKTNTREQVDSKHAPLVTVGAVIAYGYGFGRILSLVNNQKKGQAPGQGDDDSGDKSKDQPDADPQINQPGTNSVRLRGFYQYIWS